MMWDPLKGIVLIIACTMLLTVDLSKSEHSAKDEPRPGEEKDPANTGIRDNVIVIENGVVTNKEKYDKNEKLLEKEEMKEGKGEEAEANLQPLGDDATSDDGKQNQQNKFSSRKKRFLYDDGHGIWKNAIVPYVLTDSLSSGQIYQIKKTIALYEYWTCFRFPEWDNTTRSKYGLDHDNYVRFVSGGGCWSFLGNLKKRRGGQGLSCCGGSACVHEIGHAIGFHHEQNHPYRDMYLRVNPQNINPNYLSQFRKSGSHRSFRKDIPYNMNSYMHYQFWMFRKSGVRQDTMTVFNPRLRYLIDRHDPAQFYFFQEASAVYKCKDLKCSNFTMKCENGGYVAYINSTCRCRCVKGLDHTTGCTTLLRENKLEQTAQWPKSTFCLLRAANTSCPKGSKEGSITHTSDGGWTSDNYKAMGDHSTHHFCTFDHENRTAKANEWPVGEYCISRAGGKCPEDACHPGWKYNKENKHCYKLFPSRVRGFAKARALCKQHQAYIVDIKDKAENDFVNSIRSGTILLGMVDTKKEGTWVWEDGRVASYTNWRSNQPDDWYNEDCATMTYYGLWNDLHCNYWFSVMCEQSYPEFQEGFIEFEDESITKTGDLPDVTSGSKTKLEFCCRQDGNIADAIVLPTASNFILWQMNEKGCQVVKDTIAFSNFFAHRMKTGKNVTRSGTTALSYVKNNVGYAYFCVYQPISRDCGGIIELTDASPEKNVTSPYYPHSYHANMECTWLIKSPPGTRIVLNFETFEIPSFSSRCEDSLEIRFSLPEQPGEKYCGHGFKSNIYSTTNYITMYLDSNSFEKGKRFKAIVKAIKDEDHCYYPNDYGLTYRGKVGYTRHFKDCLPWSKVTNCPHSPNNKLDLYNDLTENYCRNPESGSAPWCYTDIATCGRDYCDVCGFGKCYDVLDTCDAIIKENPDYCSNRSKWNGIVGCAKTCGLCNLQLKKKFSEIICSSAKPAPEAIPVDASVTSAHVGKSIRYKYSNNDLNIYSLICYSNGTWSKMKDCPDGWTKDSSKQKCNIAVIKRFRGQYIGAKLCRQYGGYLATIKDEAEQNLVHAIVKKTSSFMLIGLDDKSLEGTFKWLNGKTFSYSHWATEAPAYGVYISQLIKYARACSTYDEFVSRGKSLTAKLMTQGYTKDKLMIYGNPDNWRGKEDCVVMRTDGYWNDINCNYHFYGVVCQIDLPVNTCKDGTKNCEKFKKVKDVAIGKQATQSSDYNSRYHADNALNSRWDMGSCTHTKSEMNPWWRVDLQSEYTIKKLVLVNRQDCCGLRLKNIDIEIGVKEDDMKKCASYDGPGSTGELVEIHCSSPMKGQYVKVKIKGAGILTLCQVMIYAYI